MAEEIYHAVGKRKRAIARIRKTCIAINGDIAGVSDEWIVVTPSFAKVHREQATQPAQTAAPEGAMSARKPMVPQSDDE